MINHPHRSKKAKAKAKPKKAVAKPEPVATAETVTCVKGFDQNLRCRDFQFEVGKTYEHSGAVKICASGFHACEYPLDVLGYYPPATSRYAVVEQSGQLARHDDDTKVVSARIEIKAEIALTSLIERAVKWVFDRAKPEGEHATGVSGAASATGVSGAASATGDRGAASATGYSGAASATGVSGAASATGVSGAASATGYSGAASATGVSGAAMASGHKGRAQGADGCALFLVHRDDNYKITRAWAGIVGQNGIKPLVWYTLNADGQPIEC